MKILWVKSDFLHPTTKGGQIRTLEMVRRLHRDHEVHYIAFDDPTNPEGLARAGEYSTKAYPIRHYVPNKTSFAFFKQVAAGLYESLPVAVSRYRSAAMRDKIDELIRKEKFDSIVCDFLFPAPNIPDLSRCVLFQHNVEAMIWRRHVEHAATPIHKQYFKLQARRMHNYEAKVSREVRSVVAVSEADAKTMREQYGITRVAAVSTGVDIDYFDPRPADCPGADLMFVGSMDWMPNIDGINWFVNQVLPLIRKQRPSTTLAIVGRLPTREVLQHAEQDSLITVTGTVPDVRPWMWNSKLSIVPLRIGGGTRLKIYEAMAGRLPVLSTTIGAEGLDITPGENILIADSAEDFATAALRILDDAERLKGLAAAAHHLVATKYSWEGVTRDFERLILQ